MSSTVFKFACSECKKEFRTQKDVLGKKLKCPDCGNTIQVNRRGEVISPSHASKSSKPTAPSAIDGGANQPHHSETTSAVDGPSGSSRKYRFVIAGLSSVVAILIFGLIGVVMKTEVYKEWGIQTTSPEEVALSKLQEKTAEHNQILEQCTPLIARDLKDGYLIGRRAKATMNAQGELVYEFLSADDQVITSIEDVNLMALGGRNHLLKGEVAQVRASVTPPVDSQCQIFLDDLSVVTAEDPVFEFDADLNFVEVRLIEEETGQSRSIPLEEILAIRNSDEQSVWYGLDISEQVIQKTNALKHDSQIQITFRNGVKAWYRSCRPVLSDEGTLDAVRVVFADIEDDYPREIPLSEIVQIISVESEQPLYSQHAEATVNQFVMESFPTQWESPSARPVVRFHNLTEDWISVDAVSVKISENANYEINKVCPWSRAKSSKQLNFAPPQLARLTIPPFSVMPLSYQWGSQTHYLAGDEITVHISTNRGDREISIPRDLDRPFYVPIRSSEFQESPSLEAFRISRQAAIGEHYPGQSLWVGTLSYIPKGSPSTTMPWEYERTAYMTLDRRSGKELKGRIFVRETNGNVSQSRFTAKLRGTKNPDLTAEIDLTVSSPKALAPHFPKTIKGWCGDFLPHGMGIQLQHPLDGRRGSVFAGTPGNSEYARLNLYRVATANEKVRFNDSPPIFQWQCLQAKYEKSEYRYFNTNEVLYKETEFFDSGRFRRTRNVYRQEGRWVPTTGLSPFVRIIGEYANEHDFDVQVSFIGIIQHPASRVLQESPYRHIGFTRVIPAKSTVPVFAIYQLPNEDHERVEQSNGGTLLSLLDDELVKSADRSSSDKNWDIKEVEDFFVIPFCESRIPGSVIEE